jgi:hypothetical protein
MICVISQQIPDGTLEKFSNLTYQILLIPSRPGDLSASGKTATALRLESYVKHWPLPMGVKGYTELDLRNQRFNPTSNDPLLLLASEEQWAGSTRANALSVALTQIVPPILERANHVQKFVPFVNPSYWKLANWRLWCEPAL